MKLTQAKPYVSALMLTLMLASVAPAEAAKKDKGQAAQRRIQQMQQQFEQEKAALTQENAEIKAKVDAVTKESEEKLSKQQQTNSRLQANLKSKDAELEALKQKAAAEHEADQAKIAELQNKLQETNNKLSQSDATGKQLSQEKTQLQASLNSNKNELGQCELKNSNIIKLSTELLNQKQKEALTGVEPLFGLRGVEIENKFQATRDEIESQRYSTRK